jgi:hypothetical protein
LRGFGTGTIADAMGVSLSTVNRAHMAYDHGGLKAFRRKPSGGRKRENMTLVEEKALLTRFAKAAKAGELLNIHDLKVAYEKAIGHETSRARSTIVRRRRPGIGPRAAHCLATPRGSPCWCLISFRIVVQPSRYRECQEYRRSCGATARPRVVERQGEPAVLRPFVS